MEHEHKDIDLEYRWFVKKLQELTGINLDSYKSDQMKRLLAKTMAQSGAANYVGFLKILQESPERIRSFRDSITINVSYMFRDVERWENLRKKLAEYITSTNSTVKGMKIWSAGCSIGAEAVTLAIIMEELKKEKSHGLLPYEILATDIDQSVIDRARDGIYTDKETSFVPPPMLERYFTCPSCVEQEWVRRTTADKFYKVKPALASRIEVKYRNIFDPINDRKFDLIVCRNVIIYFTREVTEKLMANFCGALVPGGLLFIGGTEMIFKPEALNLNNLGSGIYIKTA